MKNGVPAAWFGALVTVSAIVSATLAVWHHSIDGQTYATIVAGALGLGAGASIHAAGTQQAANVTATTAAVRTSAAPIEATTAALEAELARRGSGT